ncbi:hypothetical protein [Candidatus Contendibacter odensensis]|uniref:Uncharacterized protein n=1 Tax=Candidatus Contendobacter odensis Run_B_J11 TaxID=1400861 RepID=A0A7U7GAH5_9GAMM|nr:hypothetical protein [Candidatus Contendobacter odensis]CDH44681.1 exported hypothetical protein [Candidatus Contendobacter odensis Run_B_J11]
MKTTKLIIAGAMLSFAAAGAAYADSGSHTPAQVFPNPPSQSPRTPVAAEAGHHSEGGQDRSGKNWVKDVNPNEGSRPPVVAEAGHHSEGGQDRSGRDWVGDVSPHGHEHPTDAPASSSLRQWGWNSK